MRNEISTVIDAIDNSRIPKVTLAIFALSLAATAVLAITQNAYAWLGILPPYGIASVDVGRLGMIVGTSGTAAAFLVTLYVAE